MHSLFVLQVLQQHTDHPSVSLFDSCAGGIIIIIIIIAQEAMQSGCANCATCTWLILLFLLPYDKKVPTTFHHVQQGKSGSQLCAQVKFVSEAGSPNGWHIGGLMGIC
jgi:hypothetical protein